MKKKTKITIAVLTAVTVAFVTAAILGINAAKNAPTKYLCDKYNFDKSKIECVEYSPRHYFYDLNYWSQGWTTPTWFYEYDGNEFIVKKIDNEYYDDYQFDEYCNWCVEFLDSQLTEDVASINLSSEKFFESNRILTQSDFESMLYSMSGYTIYIRVEDITPYINDKEKARIIGDNVEKEVEKMKMGNNAYVLMVDKSVIFENYLTYFDGDRNYITLHSLTKSKQDLQKSNKLVFTNQS
ncbi:MAG: hypothetical protein ACI4IN_01970 [Eubacterium sp.]